MPSTQIPTRSSCPQPARSLDLRRVGYARYTSRLVLRDRTPWENDHGVVIRAEGI